MIKNVMIIGLSLVILTKETSHNLHKDTMNRTMVETINTLEDLNYWIIEDMNSQRVDTLIGVTYIDNIDQVLSSLRSR